MPISSVARHDRAEGPGKRHQLDLREMNPPQQDLRLKRRTCSGGIAVDERLCAAVGDKQIMVFWGEDDGA